MSEKEVQLSEKDRKSREFILNGNMWAVVFKICLPLAVFQQKCFE